MTIRFRGAVTVLILSLAASICVQADSTGQASAARGRYLVLVAGCNDCHTPGYTPSGGNIPETSWLTGDTVGWRGPWGTTYPTNLRLTMASLTEDQWVSYARRLSSKPPMPSLSLNAMTEEDLQSIYRFVRQLQPLGNAAPTYLPPGVEPSTPFILFQPPRQSP